MKVEKNMPKISVIIPVYNTEQYLERCLDSVINQELKDIEIIICNDKSSDNSCEIVKKYLKKDNRIKLINHEVNKGLSITRNDGIKIATGDYLIFIDSDDYISNNALSDLYNKIEAAEADVLFFGYNEYSVKNCELKKRDKRVNYYPKVFTGKEFFCKSASKEEFLVFSWLGIYKTKFIKQNLIKFAEYLIHEDCLFFYEVLLKARRVTSLEEGYYNYLRRDNSLTLSNDNIQNKILSQCDIVKKISDLNRENDSEMQYATNTYIKYIARQILQNYRKILFFSGRISPEQDYIIKFISAGFYKGFFTYKLPVDIVDTIKKYKYVVIYGAGTVGCGLYELLQEYGINICCFGQTNCHFNQNSIYGVPIKNIYNIKDNNELIVLIASKNNHKEMEKYIDGKFENIINMRPYL